MMLEIFDPSMTLIPLRRDPVSIILKNASIRLCLDAGPALNHGNPIKSQEGQ